MNQTSVQQLGAAFIILILAASGLLDLWLGGKWGTNATLSAQIGSWCQRYPILYVGMTWLLFHLTQLSCHKSSEEIGFLGKGPGNVEDRIDPPSVKKNNPAQPTP